MGQNHGCKRYRDVKPKIQQGLTKDLILTSEAFHSRRYAEIADTIYKHKNRLKLVLIAGPSSSGKTTTSKRIATQLKCWDSVP